MAVRPFRAIPIRMPTLLRDRYVALVTEGRIVHDVAQDSAVARLGALAQRLETHRLARKSSSLGWLFGSRERAAPIKGLYIYGEVGRGKTMLMDLFFEAAPVANKRRVHFHEFMSEVHERVFALRQQPKNGDEDAVLLAGDAIAREVSLLCFDEFHVTDIADAMILARLFGRLFDAGVIVVATSNVDPDDLYRGGLNRPLFLPFIAALKRHMEVLRLDARTDYRLEKLVRGKVWHAPADAAAQTALDEAWACVAMGDDAPLDLMVKGHRLHVPRAAHGAARFSFRELCGVPLGASDYLRIAREFHTVILDSVPVMDFDRRNEAKRFITLVDTFYDHAVKLVASADAAPHELYRAVDGFEANEFQRTVSRLIEMGSQSYLALPHGARVTDAGHEQIIET
jgi:cell division protein ZapE